MIWNYFLRMYEKQYYIIASIVVVVKTMFSFWLRTELIFSEPAPQKRPWFAALVHLQLYLPQARDGIMCIPLQRLMQSPGLHVQFQMNV